MQPISKTIGVIMKEQKSFIVIRQTGEKEDGKPKVDCASYLAETPEIATAFFNRKPTPEYFSLLYRRTNIADKVVDPLVCDVFKKSIGQETSAAITENDVNKLIHNNLKAVFKESQLNGLVSKYIVSAIVRMERVFFKDMVNDPIVVSWKEDMKDLPDHVKAVDLDGVYWYKSNKFGSDEEFIKMANNMEKNGFVRLPPRD